MTRYEVLPPDGDCISIDGHRQIDLTAGFSEMPVIVKCERCGQVYTLLILKD